MSITNLIKKSIQRIPAGKLFTTQDFHHFGNPENVRKILGRMAKSNEITRVAPSVFTRPKMAPYIGKILPSANEIAATIAKASGETIAIHGAEAARKLNLTTQTPMKSIFYTSGNSRNIKSGNRTIVLKHISPRKIVAPGTTLGLVISALWYLGKDNVSEKTIKMIKTRLTENEFCEIVRSRHRMPAWMADKLYRFQKEHAHE